MNIMVVCRLLLQLALLPLATLAAKDSKKPVNQTLEKAIELRTHSIYAPYIDQDLQNRWWDFGADAYINTNKYIRLTRAKPSQMGWLWSRLPLTAANYVIEVEFKVSGESTHLSGDGMALWLTKTRAEPGPVFGSIDKFEGLAIFLDTYANSRHTYSFPRVTAMLGDGQTSYDHGDDGEVNSIGACSANFRRTNVPTKIRVTYIRDKSLEVQLQFKAFNEWTDCFRVDGISIPTPPFIGLSAITGDVFDAHDVISVTTSSAIMVDPEKSPHKLHETSGKAKGTGSWFSFLLKLFLFAGVCTGALYGYQTYSRRNGASLGARRRGGFGGDMFSSGKRF